MYIWIKDEDICVCEHINWCELNDRCMKGKK